MIPKSIRWRLPLSYAAIALITAFALGGTLLIALRGYYRQQELNYLTYNAQAISSTLSPLLKTGLPVSALQSQLSSFAFLSQTRIRLLDPDEQVLIDSGHPQSPQEVLALSLDIEIDLEPDKTRQRTTQTVSTAGTEANQGALIITQESTIENNFRRQIQPNRDNLEPDGLHYLAVDDEPGDVSIKESIAVTTNGAAGLDKLLQPEIGSATAQNLMASMPAVDVPYGFGFGVAPPSKASRSNQRVKAPVYKLNGHLLGYIELSEGPAYGDQILASVTWGWGLAGAVAVLLAIGVGWRMSRRISRPLMALTQATTTMAQGDLSIRAEIAAQGELGRLATSFNQMANQVEETVATLHRFVADAAHALHTPLTAIRTNLELAQNNPDKVAQLNFAKAAHAQAKRLERLTNDLLDLSRLETEMSAQNFSMVNLVDLLRDNIEGYASQAEQAELTLSCELPQEAIIVWGNKAQLAQVLDNLVDNAVKFSFKGGTLQLGLRQRPTEGTVELWVEDTGIGVPPDELPHLFNRFHRGCNASTYPGSGLGLAIVQAIIARHRGQIQVENRVQGVRFSLHLNNLTTGAPD